MDGPQRWKSQDGRDNNSPFLMTDTRLHHWRTPVDTNSDSQITQAPGNHAMTDTSFTQQLNNVDIGPESDISSLQAWPSTVPSFTSQPTIYQRPFNPTSYRSTTAWASAAPSALNHYAILDHKSENFITSGFPRFESGGADESNFQYTNGSPDRNVGTYNQKLLENAIDLGTFDTDFNALESDGTGSDEHNTIINLSQFPTSLDGPNNLQMSSYPRRQSSSSFVSSAGPMNDPPDVASYPETLSYTSDYTPQSSLNMSSTPLSPVPSPRCTNQDMVRASSRNQASPSPRPSIRPTPYSFNTMQNKRAASGSFTSSPAKRSSPYPYAGTESYVPQMPVQPQVTSHSVANHVLPSSNLNPAMQYAAFNRVPKFHQPAMPPSTFDPASRVETVPYMLSNGTFRTLQSNAKPGSHAHDHFCDHADPPDLFGPLSEEQLVPPLEDMKPGNTELTPHEQELRFEGDLYTPRYVRGHGNKREGWCGICKPGRWLVLKNSAYWYDKSFTHGISAPSGQAFEGPQETRRMDGNADVWEGLCGSCGEWIALVSSKKKGTTWFRHAYKCHIHSKVKDAPKRHRECSNQRPTMTSSLSMPMPSSGTMLSAPSLDPIHSLSGRVETVAPLRPLTSMV